MPCTVIDCAALFTVLISYSCASPVLTITSKEPGNIFIAGQPVVLTLTGAATVHYDCVDFWGQTVLSGDGSGDIPLALAKPGWYELRCVDGASSAVASLGLVADRRGQTLPASGRVCAVACSAWGISREEAREPFAKMVARAGLPWIREGFLWAQTEPKRGVFDWSKYDSAIDSLHAAGVHINAYFQANFSNRPVWWHTATTNDYAPDDLRDAYEWAKAASRHYAGKIEAWEGWNEADMSGSWPDLGDRYAAAEKAFYLGFKDGNPKCSVLLGAIARSPASSAETSNFVSSMYQAGISDYYDLFNWHNYDRPEELARNLGAQQLALKENGAAIRGAWITEDGIHLRGKDGDGHRLLSKEDQIKQAQFIAQSAVYSLAAGNAKNFYFMVLDFLEHGEMQYGTLKPDFTPYPSFLALSAAANILGEASYVGRYPAGDGVESVLFDTPSGEVLCLWSNRPGTVALPVAHGNVVDLFGAPVVANVINSQLNVAIGPSITYVRGVSGLRPASPPPMSVGSTTPPRPSRTILEGYAELPINRNANAYVIEDTPFTYAVQVYNFDSVRDSQGHVAVRVPAGWSVAPATEGFAVKPMGRQVLTFRVLPGHARHYCDRIVTTGEANGHSVAPSVSFFQAGLKERSYLRVMRLNAVPSSRWIENASGKVSISDINGGIRFYATFPAVADRWVYPILRFAPALDLSPYDGIAMDVSVSAPPPDTVANLMLNVPGGATYVAQVPAAKTPSRIVVLFKDLDWAGFSHPDPAGRLDLRKVTGLQLGANTKADAVTIDVSNVEAVQLFTR